MTSPERRQHRVHLPAATTITGAENQTIELGTATGHAKGARASVSALNADLTHAVAAARGRGKDKTYYIEIDPTYYSATSKTFIGAVFPRFGMRDIADAAEKAGSGYPQISAGYVLKEDSEYVFLADTVCCQVNPKNFSARPGFSTLRAVRVGHVFAVNDSVASEWGPHSLESFVSVIDEDLTRAGNSHGHASGSGT
ncbi:MAG: ABC transporter substrate-binding protein [Steroidobacteraceae bacterium]